MTAGLSLTPARLVRAKADDGGATPALAQFLKLAATPTFVVMAVATGRANMMPLAGAMAPLTYLGGMPTMYLLMALFHAPPWLTAVFRRRPSSPPDRRIEGGRHER